jgi:hypothetical protein
MRFGKLSNGAFIIVFLLSFSAPLWAQSRPVVIQGGTLIDGTGRPPLADAAIVFQDGRIREVGKRGEVSTPQGAEMIDAKGKTILPGLIDGHCHLRDWMGEIYLHFGITTCPTISNNPTEWVIAQREGVRSGTIRGPRVWASGNVIDGPPPEGLSGLRRQRTSVFVTNEDEARKAVRAAVEKGVDGFKLFERLTPPVAKAAAEEAHRLGKPVLAHSLDIFAAADAGYQSVEHSWSVLFTSIQDPKKKSELDMARMTGKISTAEAHDAGEKHPLEPNLGHDVSPALAARGANERARAGAHQRSGIALSARLYSERQRTDLFLLRKRVAGETRSARGRL